MTIDEIREAFVSIARLGRFAGAADGDLPIDELTERVKKLLHIGGSGLWRLTDGTVDAGMGTGRGCTICYRVIDPVHVEYEVRSPTGIRAYVHYRCYKVWREESGHIAGRGAAFPWRSRLLFVRMPRPLTALLTVGGSS